MTQHRVKLAGALVMALGALSACSTSGSPSAALNNVSSHTSSATRSAASSAARVGSTVVAGTLTRQELLAPKHKYFGVSIPGAPDSLAPVSSLAAAVGKRPDLVSYYQDWTRPLNAAGATALCAAGILPLLTWESWSWNDQVNGAPAVSQPAYSPQRIASGAYDTYIRSMAASIKALKCPIMLRLDQEPNGTWYPWGIGTAGMHNTAAAYVAMWRHVWTVFHSAGVRNVLWTWSPNFLYHGGHNNIAPLYPGKKYVDIVGIDGYVVQHNDNPAELFNPTFAALTKFAKNKRWLISETGVSAAYAQPSRLTKLVHAVAVNPKLIGLVYLDQQAARANWTLTATAASTRAFRAAIGVTTFGHAPLKGL